MEKYIPYEKLSKKEKRKLDSAKRVTWGDLNPVTRKPENRRAYNRKKMQNWRKELPNSASFYIVAYNLQWHRTAVFSLFIAAQNRWRFGLNLHLFCYLRNTKFLSSECSGA